MSETTREIVLTAEQGAKYLSLCHSEHPKEFGQDKKFSADDLRTFDRNCRHLFKAIKKESPGFQARPKMIPVFGPISNWKERIKRTMRLPDGKGGIQEILAPGQTDEAMYDVVDQFLESTIKPNAYAVDAIEQMMVLFTHPLSTFHLSPSEQDRIVWELAEKMEIVPWLEGQIGLKPEKKEKETTPAPAAAAPAQT